MSRMGKERWVGAGVLDAVVLRARWETSRRLLGKERLECLIDDLGHGRPVESGVPADGLEPALFDLEGHARRLAARLLGVLEGFPPGAPPVDELAQVAMTIAGGNND